MSRIESRQELLDRLWREEDERKAKAKAAERSDFEWTRECVYIDYVASKRGNVKEMNYDTATFVRYCELQLTLAEADKQFDAVVYIQHVLDDLK